MAGRIIFADDMATNRILLKARLGAAAYTAIQASSAANLQELAMTSDPDLILISDRFDGVAGIELCSALRTASGAVPVPIVLLCDDTGRAARIAALRAGADAVLPRMPDDALLRARIRNLLRRRAADQELARAGSQEAYALAEPEQAAFTPPSQIALIAPSLADGMKWRNALATRLRDRIVVIDPSQAMNALNREPPPDAVVIAERPGAPGEAMQILSELGSRSDTLRSATVVVQARPDRERGIRALDLGVGDLVEDGFDAAEMALVLRRELARKARNDTRRAALQDGLRLAATDPLTGLYNRRFAMSQLSRILARTPESGERFALLAMDLDRFKRINDDYGHAAGDAVLVEVAERLLACLRRDDFLARIGGEEFLGVIRNCELEAASLAAERLRRAISERPIALPDGKGEVKVTMSIGLLICGGAGRVQDAARLIDLADQGLYSAKTGGRNQVTICASAA